MPIATAADYASAPVRLMESKDKLMSLVINALFMFALVHEVNQCWLKAVQQGLNAFYSSCSTLAVNSGSRGLPFASDAHTNVKLRRN